MKVQVVLPGVLFCLTAIALGSPSQGVSNTKFVPVVERSLAGCIDEQFGQYVLLDGQMLKIASLQSAGPNNGVFARYVGQQVQVKGNGSSGPKATFTVTGIVRIADKCGPAK